MPYSPPKGRVGHARVVIITVIDEEFAAARDVLDATREIEGTAYFVVEAREDREWDLVLTQALDRSNVPFSGAVADVIDDLRPQILLLVGVAGGLCDAGKGRDGIALGDVLIAETVSYVDFVKITDKGMFLRHYAVDAPSLHLRRNIAMPLKQGFELAKRVTQAPPEPCGSRILIGEIVSGDKVMGGIDNPVQTELLKPIDKALAVDMESIGMARMVCERRTSFWYNPRYAVIRGISDLVGVPGNNETRGRWKAYPCVIISATSWALRCTTGILATGAAARSIRSTSRRRPCAPPIGRFRQSTSRTPLTQRQ
jgi:nucleoside phosphorylase